MSRQSRASLQFSVVAVALVIGLSAFLHAPTWTALVQRWTTLIETDGHGFLISLIALGMALAYARRLNVQPNCRWRWVSLAVAVSASVVWALGYLTNIMLVQAVAVPAVLVGAVVAIFGLRGAKSILFPLLFLYFATPIWGVLSGPLQNLTIAVVDWFLSVLSIPALIDGHLVQISSGTFHIESGCSGLHFFVVGFALSVLYSHLCLGRWRSIILLVSATLIQAMLANWIRVAAVIYAGHVTEMQHYFVTVDHYYFGWYLFIAMLVPIYFLGSYLEKSDIRSGQNTDRRREESIAANQQGKVKPVWLVAAFATIVTIPAGAYALTMARANQAIVEIEMPTVLDGWTWAEADLIRWDPEFPGASYELCGEYRSEEGDVYVYANYYTRQSQGAELVGSASTLFHPKDARVLSSELVELPISESGTALAVRDIVLHKSGVRQVALSWYHVDGVRLARRMDVKIQELRALFTKSGPSGIVAIKADCDQDCDREIEILDRFLFDNFATISRSVMAGAE